jgi:hypothetical protein
MVTQQVPARSEGQRAMEDSLTPAERVKRQLKAGRPKRALALPASVFEAVSRLMSEAERAESLLQKYGLSPASLELQLIWRTQEHDGPFVQSRPLPASRKLGPYIDLLEQMCEDTPVDFLGVLWRLDDLDKRERAVWVTSFANDMNTVLELLEFKNKVAVVLGGKI